MVLLRSYPLREFNLALRELADLTYSRKQHTSVHRKAALVRLFNE